MSSSSSSSASDVYPPTRPEFTSQPVWVTPMLSRSSYASDSSESSESSESSRLPVRRILQRGREQKRSSNASSLHTTLQSPVKAKMSSRKRKEYNISNCPQGEKTQRNRKEAKEAKDDEEVEEWSKRMHMSIDPDVLECNVCVGPLCPPLFQCKNGHTVCCRCCKRLHCRCHMCSMSLDHGRCIALEKVIQSIKLPCAHAASGCKKTVPFTNRAHEKTCTHALCRCPFVGCSVRGTAELIKDHLILEHKLEPKTFDYPLNFSVTIKRGQKLVALQGTDGALFLLLNKVPTGLFVSCVAPNSTKAGFSYELTARRNGRIIGIEDSVVYLQEQFTVKNCLTVPPQFENSLGEVSVTIMITKS